MSLVTSRLELIPYTPAQLVALVDSPEAFQSAGGIPAADGLREFFTSGDVSSGYLPMVRAAPGPDPWTLGFAVVHRARHLVVGNAGFTGPPDEAGEAEIAYGIVPAFQRQGLASEAAVALIRFAFTDVRVRRLRAHTLARHNASTRILARNAFRFAGEVTLPDDGTVWRWELDRPDSTAGTPE